MGDTDAVMAILNSKALPLRPTRPIKNHRKEGVAAEWYRKMGVKLMIPEKSFTVRSPEDVIPEGVTCVSIACSLETIELPPSVCDLTIEDGAHLEEVPAVWLLWIEGTFGTLSREIVKLHNNTHDNIVREKLEHVTGLRHYHTESSEKAWFPAWVKSVDAVDIDADCLVGSALETLYVRNSGAFVLPPTLHTLTITNYKGEFPLPSNLKFLDVTSSSGISSLPEGLDTLAMSRTPPPIAFPKGLRILDIEGADLTGLAFPDSLRYLRFDNCTKVPAYPRFLHQLTVSDAASVPPIPETVSVATFIRCSESPEIYSNVKKLEALKLLSCDATFGKIPACVAELYVQDTPIVSCPMTLVSLICPKPEDFDENVIMSNLRLDSLRVSESQTPGAPFSTAAIIRMSRLRRLSLL